MELPLRCPRCARLLRYIGLRRERHTFLCPEHGRWNQDASGQLVAVQRSVQRRLQPKIKLDHDRRLSRVVIRRRNVDKPSCPRLAGGWGWGGAGGEDEDLEACTIAGGPAGGMVRRSAPRWVSGSSIPRTHATRRFRPSPVVRGPRSPAACCGRAAGAASTVVMGLLRARSVAQALRFAPGAFRNARRPVVVIGPLSFFRALARPCHQWLT